MKKSALCGGVVVLALCAISVCAGRAFAETNGGSNGTDGALITGPITNTVKGGKLVNIAAGTESRASLGSVVVVNSQLTGAVANSADVCELMNIADGQNAHANLCTVKIENSCVGSTIVNRVTGACAKNIAMGDESCANYGSVVIKNQGCEVTLTSSLPDEIVNDVTIGGVGNDCNVAEAGQVSNKNSIVFK